MSSTLPKLALRRETVRNLGVKTSVRAGSLVGSFSDNAGVVNQNSTNPVPKSSGSVGPTAAIRADRLRLPTGSSSDARHGAQRSARERARDASALTERGVACPHRAMTAAYAAQAPSRSPVASSA
jgi:hypothetical protein